MVKREIGHDVIILPLIKKSNLKTPSPLKVFQGPVSAVCVMFGYNDSGSRETVDCRLFSLDH